MKFDQAIASLSIREEWEVLLEYIQAQINIIPPVLKGFTNTIH